jgi:uncharacterized Zn-binding protein involved in type VI secretion
MVQCYVGNRGAILEQPVRSLQGFLQVIEAGKFPAGDSTSCPSSNSGRQVIESTEYAVWIGGDSLASNAAHCSIQR